MTIELEKTKRWIRRNSPDSNRRDKFQREKVEAWVIEGIPDLFINRCITGNPEDNNKYVISHYHTGLRLGLRYAFLSRKSAAKALVRISKIADWKFKDGRKFVEDNPIMADLCNEIAEEVGNIEVIKEARIYKPPSKDLKAPIQRKPLKKKRKKKRKRGSS